MATLNFQHHKNLVKNHLYITTKPIKHIQNAQKLGIYHLSITYCIYNSIHISYTITTYKNKYSIICIYLHQVNADTVPDTVTISDSLHDTAARPRICTPHNKYPLHAPQCNITGVKSNHSIIILPNHIPTLKRI